MLVILAFLFTKDTFINTNGYNWTTYNKLFIEFLVFLIGPLITSFVSIFSIYYEYSQKTMKNILTTPFSRINILFICLFIYFFTIYCTHSIRYSRSNAARTYFYKQ